MSVLIKLRIVTRKRLNKLVAEFKKTNPEIRNSVTQDYVVSKALTALELEVEYARVN